MKKMFGFVNVEGGTSYDITESVMGMDYNMEVSAAASVGVGLCTAIGVQLYIKVHVMEPA